MYNGPHSGPTHFTQYDAKPVKCPTMGVPSPIFFPEDSSAIN